MAVFANSGQICSADAAVPFGGYKSSGIGRESGIEHMHEFLETKSVWINLD